MVTNELLLNQLLKEFHDSKALMREW